MNKTTQRRARLSIFTGLALLSMVGMTQAVFWLLDNTIAGDYVLKTLA